MSINKLTQDFLHLHSDLLKTRDIRTLIHLVPYVMSFVENLSRTEPQSGPDKKQLVIDIVDRIFDETTIGGPLDPIIDAIAKAVVPELIELCILISRRFFNLQAEEDKSTENGFRFCGCF